MTERVCPTCSRVIDPVRAPVARIAGARIVTYCSAACARGEPEVVPVASVPAPAPVAAVAPATPPVVAPVAAVTPVAEQRAAVVLAEAPKSTRSSRMGPRTRALAIAGGIAAAAMGVAVVQSLSPSAPAPASAATEDPPPPVAEPAPPPAAPAAPAPPERAALYAGAKALLARYLEDPSPRVRLLAAVALSRTGDAAALAELAKALGSDPSAIRRLEVAYALARAGDARGAEHLVAALSAKRRDVRLEAARSLARLGDERAKPRLREAMHLRTLQLSAAEPLAILGDDEARRILAEALASKIAEHRMRAAVALGRAGDPAGLPILMEMAKHPRVELGAADALARLGEREAAIPALTRALALSALRVDAAVALRRLGADVDLVPLADALEVGDEVGRISAAEAVIVLLDPAQPAELR